MTEAEKAASDAAVLEHDRRFYDSLGEEREGLRCAAPQCMRGPVRALQIAADDLVALARQNTEKHYGDVLAEGYVIDTPDGEDGVRRELQARGLPDHLETGSRGLMFWTPRGSNYRTRSRPTE